MLRQNICHFDVLFRNLLFRLGSISPMNSQMRNSAVVEPCIYCGSIRPATKREHVMSRALGTFEQNWTLDCVCDECNQYFADNLELPLGRDSREAVFSIDLGIRP